VKIVNLHIRRFKSLYDVELSLEPFSVVTGPNGSGKTNFVDAIAFLGEVYQFGFEYAVGRAGGIDAISFRDKRRTTIGVEFAIKAELKVGELRQAINPRLRELWTQLKDVDLSIEHSFVLKPATIQSGLDYVVGSERLKLSMEIESEWTELLLINQKIGEESVPVVHEQALSDDSMRLVLGNALRNIGSWEGTTELGASVIQYIRISPVIREFARHMSTVRAYRLNPGATRQPAVLTPNATLDNDGGNLPAVVARISRQQPIVWKRVLAGMRQLLPELEDIKTEPSAEHGLILLFSERGRGRPWSAYEVSDGTIQALALLLLLFDPRVPLVLVEEPENAVHPWILRRFLEACRSLKNKQIILTTHSPVLLKLVRPEEVFLMWRSSGRSKIRPLMKVLPDVQRLYYDEGFDIFEVYDSGMIAEVIPGTDGGGI
jgi:predicted ATPase